MSTRCEVCDVDLARERDRKRHEASKAHQAKAGAAGTRAAMRALHGQKPVKAPESAATPTEAPEATEAPDAPETASSDVCGYLLWSEDVHPTVCDLGPHDRGTRHSGLGMTRDGVPTLRTHWTWDDHSSTRNPKRAAALLAARAEATEPPAVHYAPQDGGVICGTTPQRLTRTLDEATCPACLEASPTRIDRVTRLGRLHTQTYRKNVPDAQAEALRRLDVVSDLLEEAERLRAELVDDARAAGASWSKIGQNIGVTRQAAQMRYGQQAPRTSAAVDPAQMTID
jgi:hypothetical protein